MRQLAKLVRTATLVSGGQVALGQTPHFAANSGDRSNEILYCVHDNAQQGENPKQKGGDGCIIALSSHFCVSRHGKVFLVGQAGF